MSAANREGGGGRVTGRVGSGQALRGSGRVGSDNWLLESGRVGSGPDPGGSGRVRTIGPGNNSGTARGETAKTCQRAPSFEMLSDFRTRRPTTCTKVDLPMPTTTQMSYMDVEKFISWPTGRIIFIYGWQQGRSFFQLPILKGFPS